MDLALPTIPIKYAKLIIGYTHNKLSEAEGDELDRWIAESDENLEIFEALADGTDDNVFSPEELIIETDDLLDTWMIAGLIARQMQDILSVEEKRMLDEWMETSPQNKSLYETFSDKANLQKFVSWLKKSTMTLPPG